MTDETPHSPNASIDPAGETPRAKRVSNPRPKKQPRAPKEESKPAEPAEVEVVIETAEEFPPASGDWPEPDPASTGGSSAATEGGKRKRRRKKGKGGKPQEPAAQAEDESPADEKGESAARSASSQSQPPRPQHPQQAARPKLDSDAVAKLACKIYLAEVGEEGVALIGDGDAKELARRCFRLSEIFLEEQTRRR